MQLEVLVLATVAGHNFKPRWGHLMLQNCWNPENDTGFLMSPDPVSDLSAMNTGLAQPVSSSLEDLAGRLPDLIKSGALRAVLTELEPFDVSGLGNESDFRVVERAFQIYSHFANAFVWCEEKNPEDHLPAGVAIPLVALSKMVDRPPILPYATTSLSNFRRKDPAGELVVENLECIIKLVDIPDESWFHLIHIEIEAHAAIAVQSCVMASAAIANDDAQAVETALSSIPQAFEKMMSTFKRMGEHCSPDVYYYTLRPYLFGFDGIVYKGVDEYKELPQTFRGETGAQSTVIPALKAFLGVTHEKGGLTNHLETMKAYMPTPHREFLAQIDNPQIRNYVIARKNSSLKKHYNECLKGLFEFRSLHFTMVHDYIASKVKNPIGTGGTEFMHWLQILRDETAEQYL